MRHQDPCPRNDAHSFHAAQPFGGCLRPGSASHAHALPERECPQGGDQEAGGIGPLVVQRGDQCRQEHHEAEQPHQNADEVNDDSKTHGAGYLRGLKNVRT